MLPRAEPALRWAASEPPQPKLEERLDMNSVISGMTQGSEEQFVAPQNEICLTATRGKFKTGVKHIVFLAKEEKIYLGHTRQTKRIGKNL